MAYMSVYMDVRISIFTHMCEINIKDIYSCAHAYMQMGIYITIFAYVHVCTYMYTCVEVIIYLCM